MRADELRAVLGRRPFEPFRLHLADGRAFDVRHTEGIFVAPKTVTVGLPPRGQEASPEEVAALATVKIADVSRVEPLPAGLP